MNILGIIPARGGSKGIKNKNIIELAGKPLISYSITALKNAEYVNRVVVTTDSDEIATIAKQYGAEVPFMRPSELAQDNSPTYPAIKHAVLEMEKLGFRADYIVTAQPTYPLVQPKEIDAAVKMVIEKNADSVITACELGHDCHPYNIRQINQDGTVSFWKEDEHYKFPTRQRKPKFYIFGNIFVSSYKTVVEDGRLEGKKNYLIEIDKNNHLDVNTEEDLIEIEQVINQRTK